MPLLADAGGVSPARPSTLMPASGAASLAGAADGGGGGGEDEGKGGEGVEGPSALPLPLCTLPLPCGTERWGGGPVTRSAGRCRPPAAPGGPMGGGGAPPEAPALGGGGHSCAPGPSNPEPLRLSALTGCPLPPTKG